MELGDASAMELEGEGAIGRDMWVEFLEVVHEDPVDVELVWVALTGDLVGVPGIVLEPFSIERLAVTAAEKGATVFIIDIAPILQLPRAERLLIIQAIAESLKIEEDTVWEPSNAQKKRLEAISARIKAGASGSSWEVVKQNIIQNNDL